MTPPQEGEVLLAVLKRVSVKSGERPLKSSALLPGLALMKHGSNPVCLLSIEPAPAGCNYVAQCYNPYADQVRLVIAPGAIVSGSRARCSRSRVVISITQR